MKKIKEIYSLEVNENLNIELEINNKGNVTVIKAEEVVYYEDTEFDEYTYCKPNIKFTIIPELNIEEQVRYHLAQRDRIEKIKKKLENTKLMLIKRNIR